MANDAENGGEVLDPIEDIEEVLDESGADITDWRALALKNQGIAKRYQTKLEKLREVKPEVKPEIKEPEKPQDKTSFDLAEETYLLQKGVKENQFSLVLEEVKKSGKSIKEVLGSRYFQEQLEVAASADATPQRGERGGGSAQNEVSYWIQKADRGENPFPPNTPENRELRRKIAKELAKQSENQNKFAKDAIV